MNDSDVNSISMFDSISKTNTCFLALHINGNLYLVQDYIESAKSFILHISEYKKLSCNWQSICCLIEVCAGSYRVRRGETKK